MKITFLMIFLICLLFSSCSVTKFAGYYLSSESENDGSLNGRIYSSKKTSYKIGELSNSWKRVKTKEGDLLFSNEVRDAVLTINSTCEPGKKKYSLKALSESLTIGIKSKQLIERKEIEVDNEPALYSNYLSELSGQKINIATIVTKKNSCIYDFSTSYNGSDFGTVLEPFFMFVNEFEVLR